MAQIEVNRPILEANQRAAAENRRQFDQAGIKVLNFISSPGAGKTSILEKTLARLSGKVAAGVIVGDIQTTEDARRIAACGVKAIQIETQGACHLDGAMIGQALTAFDLKALDLLIIENVGNLVCPAEFHLGEDMKVAVLSVAEGDDKPSKYPLIFKEAGVLLLNKIDLLPYVNCDLARIRETCARLNPGQVVFELSCQTGQGLEGWVDWLIAWARSAES
jgi:hydrogenase nickel incorporation protein HypB